MRNPNQSGPLVITCARGVQPVLAEELRALGFDPQPLDDTATGVEGGLAEAMQLNLHLRTAQRVLLELCGFPATSPESLFTGALREAWEEVLYPDGYLSITASTDLPGLRDPRFPALKLKDAVVDRMVKACGRRPDSGSARSGAVLHLHLRDGRATVLADTSGEPLARRGYRLQPGKAPMQETLAAACILHTAWRGGQAFVNPMCGSGTLAIEAALIALNRAPGLLRKGFGFEHLKGYREAEWKALHRAAEAAVRTSSAGPILGSDISPAMIDAARENAARAGVGESIQWSVCDYAATELPAEGGVIFLNPEYGERLGEEQALEPLYRGIGDFFKQRGTGYWGYVFTGNLKLARCIGLRSHRRLMMYNGGIECRLLEFELYQGTRDPGDGEDAPAKKERDHVATPAPTPHTPPPHAHSAHADGPRAAGRGPRRGPGPRADHGGPRDGGRGDDRRGHGPRSGPCHGPGGYHGSASSSYGSGDPRGPRPPGGPAREGNTRSEPGYGDRQGRGQSGPHRAPPWRPRGRPGPRE